MTRDEALEILDHNWTRLVNPDYTDEELGKAQNMAIEALEKATPIPNGNLINFGDIGSPTIKPLERKRGEWEWVQYDANNEIGNYHCTECGFIPASWNLRAKHLKFCPNCGSDNRGEE